MRRLKNMRMISASLMILLGCLKSRMPGAENMTTVTIAKLKDVGMIISMKGICRVNTLYRNQLLLFNFKSGFTLLSLNERVPNI